MCVCMSGFSASLCVCVCVYVICSTAWHSLNVGMMAFLTITHLHVCVYICVYMSIVCFPAGLMWQQGWEAKRR